MSTAAESVATQSFLQELISHGYLLPSAEPGVFGRGAIFEQVRTGVDALVTRIGAADRPETPRFPPLVPRLTIEKAGYLKSFPQLCGTVYSFSGSERAAADLAERAERHDDWSTHLTPTDVVMVPAACYPAYPAMALRGPLPPGGVSLDLGGCYVYRHEPSLDPARLQIFHQRELVRIGTPDEVLGWRETWMARARRVFDLLALDAHLDIASDAFFGRGGKLLAKSQREQRLKFEALVPIANPDPTAVASFNFHQEHFGEAFGIQLHDGSVASSACVGFGLERISLALFRAHGIDLADWPQAVCRELWPTPVE